MPKCRFRSTSRETVGRLSGEDAEHRDLFRRNVSHEALLGLMALQLEVVTSALSNAAAQLERAPVDARIVRAHLAHAPRAPSQEPKAATGA